MRVFEDEMGREWTVWEVRPAHGGWSGTERRSGHDRRGMAGGAIVRDRRRSAERRVAASRALRTLGVTLAAGWLAFQSGTTRRRLMPIPFNWFRLPDHELAALCEQARPLAPATMPIPGSPAL